MAQTIKEYAEAIFAIALEEGKPNEYGRALEQTLEVFAENPEYMDLLASHAIPKAERVECIGQAFSELLPEHVLSLVQLLCENDKITMLDECVKEYRRLLDEANRVTKARVVSSVELTDIEKQRLTEKLEKMSGNTVELECVTDPAILGGLVIEMNGKIMDGSLRHRLHEAKDVMSR